jgi:uncharacterized protein (DUF1330 family)
MSAYVIAETRVTDPSRLAEYLDAARPSVERHGGRYLTSSTNVTALEGVWPAGVRVVIVEFSDVEAAKAWYHSADYAKALAIRAVALERRLFIVDGEVM